MRVTLLFVLAAVQPSPEDRIREALARQAQAITDASLAGLETREDWEKRRLGLRARLLGALGLDPLPDRSPLDPAVTSAFEEEKFRVETLLFKALPGFYLTANLYVPRDGRAKHPGILYVCGHAQDALGAKVKYQHHPVWLASRGYVVLIVDPIQISEIEAIHHGTYRYDHWHWQALGYTPLGLEVWCAMRSLDYLASRPEVDAERLGMTGRSGGGTMTWFTMALDERVKAGVSANATGLVGTHVRNDTLKGHCDCAFFINHAKIDYSDVAALCAPRPVLVQSGTQDWIYPPEGYRPLGKKARKAYELLGAAEKFAEQDVEAKHVDLMEFRTEAYRWFERWLKGARTDEAVAEVPAIDRMKLRAVRGPLPGDVRNHSIAESFPGPYVSRAPAGREEWEKREERLQADLDRYVFAGDPGTAEPLDLAQDSFLSEPAFRIRFEYLNRLKDPEAPPRVLVVVSSTDAKGEPDWKKVSERIPVFRVFPRSMGGENWSPALAKFVRRAAPLLGRSLGTMQVWDVRRAMAAAKELSKAPRVALYGREDRAMLALAAALRQPETDRVLLDSLPDSLLAEPILLNAARITDVPELVSLAVPRGLIFMGRSPLSFGRACDTARLHGRPGLSLRAASIDEALDELRR